MKKVDGPITKVAVVGFTFNHPTAKRSLAVFDLIAQKFKVHLDVLTVNRWGEYVYADLDNHIKKNLKIHKLYSLFFSTHPSQYRSFMPFLFFKLLCLRPDVIYAHEEPATVNALSCLIAAKVLKKPFIVTSWENLHQRWFFPLNAMEKLIARNVDFFVAGTEDVKSVFMKKKVKGDRISVMPLSGVDTAAFRPLKSRLGKELGLAKDNTLIFVGRIIEMKGIKVILGARDILLRRKKKYNYLFVGFGSQNDLALVKGLQESNKGDIFLLEDLDRKQIPDAFNAAAISLCPSVPTPFWQEQFGYSVAESLACGVPVVASDLTGPRYIIQDGKDGFLVPSNDAHALADRIVLLMSDKRLRDGFSRFARKDIQARFSNDSLSRNLFALWKMAQRGR